jgi:anti-sigma factor RsiW
MNDQWTERLSEYLDDELPPAERAALDAHLAGCAACRALLEDLARVRARARSLPDQPPANDLWPAIARGMAAGRRAPRIPALSVPQLLAASLALMLASGGLAWLAARRSTHAPPSVAAGPAWGASPAWKSESSYAAAITQLEAALEAGRSSGALDTATVHALVHSLAVVDTAILEARRALAADPASAYLNHHLADTMRRKLDLLRQVSAIASSRT